jgi:hypothetical protein
MYAKVIGATFCLDSTAVVATDVGNMKCYAWRYKTLADTASGTPLDSLLTGNIIVIDSTVAVAGGNFKALTVKATNSVLSDSQAIEVQLITTNHVITSQAHASVTFEIYVKPE